MIWSKRFALKGCVNTCRIAAFSAISRRSSSSSALTLRPGERLSPLPENLPDKEREREEYYWLRGKVCD